MGNTVLVVDDDPIMRELLRIHLANAGYTVAMASDGVEAGYAVLRSRPDLIIADVNMPYLDGFALVEAMRGEPALQDVPVIFLTSHAQGHARGRALGAVDYLEKPIRADRLLSLVAHHLARVAAPEHSS